MRTTYDVRIWKTTVYRGQRVTTYYVRWSVAGKEWKEPFKAKALAESFRADLVAAARKGEAFDIASGRPVSMRRASRDVLVSVRVCFCRHEMAKRRSQTRRTHSEALTTVTTALLTDRRRKPDDRLIRSALCRWAFNTKRQINPDCPGETRQALRWIEAHTRSVSELTDPECCGRFWIV